MAPTGTATTGGSGTRPWSPPTPRRTLGSTCTACRGRCWLAQAQQSRPGTAYLEAETTLGTPDDEVTTVIDSSEHLPVRERAIALHASQTSPFAGLPDDLYRDFLAVERLRRVRPEWTGGPRETRLLPPS